MTVATVRRRLTTKTLNTDLNSLNGLAAVENYIPARAEATPAVLKAAYETMLARQQKETEQAVLLKAAANTARQAEWDFHNAVLAMKESVRGQFGPDSNAAQAVGYKKKSEYKRPRRSAKTMDS